MKWTAVIKISRPKHYIKNLLILLPLFFNRQIFDTVLLVPAVWGFICFCCLSSAVYIFNDIRDCERDKAHPKKCGRPIPAGDISKPQALLLALLLALAAVAACLFTRNMMSFFILAVYLASNLLYSCGMKNKPIADVVLLVLGYFLRVAFGSVLTGIAISHWMYLTVISFSTFMALGKRKSEIYIYGAQSRPVLEYYSHNFLTHMMYTFLTAGLVFFSLWVVNIDRKFLLPTIPLIMIIFMQYCLAIEKGDSGDPVEVILSSPMLILELAALSGLFFVSIYF